MDHVEEGDRVARLVGLQRADEVELDLAEALAQGRPLALRLLDVVLAEGPLPGGEDRLDRLGGKGLGHRDEGHILGVAAAVPGRAGDGGADVSPTADGGSLGRIVHAVPRRIGARRNR